jgi:hypothetical protein
MILVDELKTYPSQMTENLPSNTWCHLWSDAGEDELHDFAQKIGLKRSWFQDKKQFPHYDLVATKRILAIRCGAKQTSLQTYLKTRLGS